MRIIIGIPLIFVMLVLCEFSFSQSNSVTNYRTTISGDNKLFINYEIVASENAETVTVELQFTYEGNPINPNPDNIYGDFGSNIPPGDKLIYWDFSNESIQDIRKVNVEIILLAEKEPHAVVEVISTSNNGYAPSLVVFENLSTNADVYHWDFGDPTSGLYNTSTDFNPKHTFNNAGLYSVTLTARQKDTGQESTFYKTVEISTHNAPLGNFRIDDNNLKAPVTITFTNLSMNADNFIWNFGDFASKNHNISQEKNPKHKYSAGGTYQVHLFVINSLSGMTDTVVKEVVIQKADIPVAGFSYAMTSEFAPAIVDFENTSKFIVKYKWDFGDEFSGDVNESNEESPVHLYEKPGIYVVRLEAKPKGLKTSVHFSDTIRIKDPAQPLKAGFIIENNNIYAPSTIIFKNTSIDATEYSWNFGDPESGSNNTSSEKNPTHTYNRPGKYKVVLVGGSKDLKEKSVFTNTVTILEIPIN